MPISNYPSGFAQGVAIRGIPLLNLHGGNVFWVDSNKGADTGKGTHNQPFETWDYTVGRCVAGDIIILKAGHVETVTAAAGLALDVAGVTTIFLGSGANQAYVTFTTDVGADMDVDAASITLINPKFVAGIDALTGPIDINAADFTIVNGEYHDAAGIETTDCMTGVAAAARLCIDGWKYFKSDEAGTQKESHFQFDGLDDLILRNIHVEGDFDVGIIEIAGTDECLRMTMEDHFLKNTDPGNAPCATLDSECSGWARRLNWRNADGTVVDDVADINWASDALGYTTDGYSGDPIGTAAASGVEGKLDIIDGLHDVPTADATTNLYMRDVVGIKTDAAVGTGTTTKTLMAYIKGILDDTGAAGVVLGADAITAAKVGDNALSEEHFDGDAVQAMTMGKKVSKATAVLGGTSTENLFTVGTGRVVVHAIVGEVTTLVQTQATVCKLISTPTTGTAADLCTTLDLTADEAGCLYGITGLTGDALIGTNAGATICPKHGVVVPIGVIGFNNASAANTGSVKWDIYYTPLDTGATIVSA
jgi:hypothetical protein